MSISPRLLACGLFLGLGAVVWGQAPAPAPAPAASPTPAAAADPGASAAPADDSYQTTLLFTRVVELIRQDYVDEGKIAYRDLIYAALKGMLSSLDPHSQFLDEDAFAEMQRDTKGEFTGLGLIVGIKDGSLVVLDALEDTPGYRAGIMAGDHILKINDTSTDKMSYDAAKKMLRGKRGEKIRMTLYRPPDKPQTPPAAAAAGAAGDTAAQENIFEVEMTREVIRVSTVKDPKVLPPEIAGDDLIGYIRIEQFGENTSAEFDKAYDDLQKQGIRALVVDLRNNPGGLIDAAVDIAGVFLPSGTMVVSTQGRTDDSHREYRSHGTHPQITIPVALLINGFSASGSEIVAGALQDLHRATLVGETTFGKGSVQSVINLGDGVGIRLTTAKYYTPSHRVINEKGVDPDIAAPITAAEDRTVIRLRSPQLLTAAEKLDVKGFHDTQLERATAVLRGILIHADRTKAAAPAAAPASAPTPIPSSPVGSAPAVTPNPVPAP